MCSSTSGGEERGGQGSGRGGKERGVHTCFTAWSVISCDIVCHCSEYRPLCVFSLLSVLHCLSAEAWLRPVCCHPMRQTWWMEHCLYWGWCHTRWVGHGGASATPGGWVMVGLVPHQVGGTWWGWCHTWWVGRGGAQVKDNMQWRRNCRVDVELELGLGL